MDIERFTERARGFVQAAQTLALARGHQRLTGEHMLQQLLSDDRGLVAGLLRAAGASPETALAETEAALARLPVVEGDGAGQVMLSPELARVLECALRLAAEAGDRFVTVERLLLASPWRGARRPRGPWPRRVWRVALWRPPSPTCARAAAPTAPPPRPATTP